MAAKCSSQKTTCVNDSVVSAPHVGATTGIRSKSNLAALRTAGKLRPDPLTAHDYSISPVQNSTGSAPMKESGLFIGVDVEKSSSDVAS